MSIKTIYLKGNHYTEEDLDKFNNHKDISINNKLVIRVSGLAGSGKGTLSKNLAKKLTIPHIEGSLILRACTYIYEDLNLEINEKNTEKVFQLFELKLDGLDLIAVYNNKKLSYNDLKNDFIDRRVANYASIHSIREQYYKKLSKFVSDVNSSCVLDGRGANTPYLKEIASSGKDVIRFQLYVNDEIGYQRYLANATKNNVTISRLDYQKSIIIRNSKDVKMMKKENLPLSIEGSHTIDTSYMRPEQVVKLCMNIIKIDKK